VNWRFVVERYRRLGLRAKFAIHAAVSVVLLFGVLVPGVVYLQTRAALEQARQRGFGLTKVFAHSSVQALVGDDFLIMRQIINSVASDPDVLYVMILDPSGRVLAHSDMRYVGRQLTDAPSRKVASARHPLIAEWRDGSVPTYDFAVPIYVMNERRAVARIGISLVRELDAIRQTRNAILGLALVALLVGVSVAIWRARTVTRPVSELLQGARAITRGHLAHRIEVRGGDELGQLARAFNRMTESLQALMETSRQLSSTLDPNQVLTSVAAYARDLAKADVAAIAPYDPVTQQARVHVALGARTENVENMVVEPWRGLGGLVLATGQPAASPGAPESPQAVRDARYDEMCVQEGIASAVAVPIMLKDEIVGLLWVANRKSSSFSGEDVDALCRIAHQAALALENARHYQDLKRSHEELVSTQTELVRKTRMAAIGEISAVVAHEARNPLGAISNCVQMLRTNPHITGEDLELLEIVQAESQRLNEIISDFLTFGRPRAPRFEPVVLQEAIEDTLVLLRRDQRCGATIAFSIKFEAGVPPVEADRDQLRQVFWNLFLNAVQAMGDRGQLRVEVRRQGDVAEIEIHDSGRGISRSVQPRIFEPFYTTRPGGTGLGLATVRHIIEEHHGEIRVESEVGIGTCFTVTLPFDQTTS
jgi:signal transduction histidine kinase